MVRAWRRVSERGEGSRNPGRNEDDHIDHKRRLHGRIIVSPEGSPRRDDTSYVEALRGKQPCSSITPCLEEFRPSEYDLPESSKDGPWRKVQSRKRRRTPPTGACIKPRPNRGETQLLRRSPPTKLIAGRVAEVCGNCLQPGHLKAECRKLEVCRRCELAGHRSSRCSVTSSELRRLRRSREEQARMRGRQTLAKAEEGGGHHKRGKEGRGGNQLPGRNPPSEEEVHYIPMPINDELADEKEKLKSVSIATITKVSDGIADHRKLAAALAERFAPVGPWPVTPLEDDRIVVKRPFEAATETRKAERKKFPTFTVSFEQWTADLDSPEKAEASSASSWDQGRSPLQPQAIQDREAPRVGDHARRVIQIKRPDLEAKGGRDQGSGARQLKEIAHGPLTTPARINGREKTGPKKSTPSDAASEPLTSSDIGICEAQKKKTKFSSPLVISANQPELSNGQVPRSGKATLAEKINDANLKSTNVAILKGKSVLTEPNRENVPDDHMYHDIDDEIDAFWQVALDYDGSHSDSLLNIIYRHEVTSEDIFAAALDNPTRPSDTSLKEIDEAEISTPRPGEETPTNKSALTTPPEGLPPEPAIRDTPRPSEVCIKYPITTISLEQGSNQAEGRINVLALTQTQTTVTTLGETVAIEVQEITQPTPEHPHEGTRRSGRP
ncbi:hypothetical protein J5N97_016342 [Dioscorea zingiberensis]|uniref:CCHC-type domain-containing protein n=1 Tax=Dioscorea zingiberensis TaxID=325984 RepID=A0A9D5CJN9_9LILI|nr:hypothetical protein J5N97_016342 [Dioscorea zingiberensis]